MTYYFATAKDSIIQYWKIILLNLKMCLCAWWIIFFAIAKDIVFIVQNLFQELSIFKTERSSSEIWDDRYDVMMLDVSDLKLWV